MSEMPEEILVNLREIRSEMSDNDKIFFSLGFQRCFEIMQAQQKPRPIDEAPKDVDVLFINVKRNSFYKGKVVTDTVSNFGHEYIPIMPFDTPTHFTELPTLSEGGEG